MLVVFEDADKAHPEVLEVLLRVCEEGQLQDSEGKLASFRNAVLVFTLSPSASSSSSTSSLNPSLPSPRHAPSPAEGAAATEPSASDSDSASASASSASAAATASAAGAEMAAAAAGSSGAGAGGGSSRPTGSSGPIRELLAAVDSVVDFQPLGPSDVRRVVELQLGQLGRQLGASSGCAALRWDDGAVELLASRGSSAQHGLKPLAGVLRQAVLGQLADAMLVLAAEGGGEGGDGSGGSSGVGGGAGLLSGKTVRLSGAKAGGELEVTISAS
jgi:hypothetical protein